MGVTVRLLFFVGLMAVAVAAYMAEGWYYKIPVWILIAAGCYKIVNFVSKD